MKLGVEKCVDRGGSIIDTVEGNFLANGGFGLILEVVFLFNIHFVH